MPIVFGVIGIILVVSGVRGTVTSSNPNLVDLVKTDLTGQPNYIEWMTAIFILGAVGYIPQLRTLSRMLMAIVVIDLFFTNKGFFQQFSDQLKSLGKPPQPVQVQNAGLSASQTASAAATGVATGLSGITPFVF